MSGTTLDNQLAYTGGEFSPQMDARVDHPKYRSGCRQLQNMIALRTGGATRRPGTIFKAKAKYQNTDIREYATRLMDFQFSPSTSFILEFGDRYLRFYSNQQQVTLDAADLWDAGASYVLGNFVEDPGAANAIYYCIADVGPGVQPHDDPTHWVLQDIYEIPTPFNGQQFKGPSIYEIDIWRLISCQINDVIYLVHPSYPPYKLERFGDTDWRLSQVVFLTPPLLDANATGVWIAATATIGNVTLQANAAAWVAGTYYQAGNSVNPGGAVYTCIVAHQSGATFAPDLANGYWRLEEIFSGSNIGGYFQISHLRNSSSVQLPLTADATSAQLEASGAVQFQTFGTWSATATLERSDDGGTSWTAIRTITSLNDNNGSIDLDVGTTPALFRLVVTDYTASAGAPRVVFTSVAGFVRGIVRITAVANAYAASAVVVERLSSTNTTIYWAEGAWSARRGYPQAVTAFQQRMIYGGSSYEPLRLWGTRTNDLENFDFGDQDKLTDAFAFDLAAVGRGRIQWLLGQIDLFVGFSGAEWVVNSGKGSYGGANEPLGPTQINAAEHSAWGSAEGVPPALVGNAVLFPQRSARTLQQMQFEVESNKYVSDDMTALSEHMFGAGIAQIAYQPQFRNQAVIWTINKAGALCGMTYEARADVYGWHRHISGYDSGNDTIEAFESVAAIDGQNSDDDEVWVVVRRPNGRCIELINPNNWEVAGDISRGIAQPDVKEAIYVDAAVTVRNPADNVVTGLDHIEGQDVIGLINGNTIFGPITVESGSITIDGFVPNGTDIIHVGLPIDYAVQGMRMDANPQRGILMGIMKSVSRTFLRVFNSLSGKVESNGAIQVPVPYRLQSTTLGQVGPLTTGQKEVNVNGTQSDDPIIIVRGNDPLPLTLLATTTRMGISGST